MNWDCDWTELMRYWSDFLVGLTCFCQVSYVDVNMQCLFSWKYSWKSLFWHNYLNLLFWWSLFFWVPKFIFNLRWSQRDTEEHQQLYSASYWEQRDKMEVMFIKIASQEKKKRQKFACVSSSSYQKLFLILVQNIFTDYMYIASSISEISFGPFWIAEKNWNLVYSFTLKNKLPLTILPPLKRNSFLGGLSAPFFLWRAIIIDLEWKNNRKTVLLSIAVVISSLACSLYVVLRS